MRFVIPFVTLVSTPAFASFIIGNPNSSVVLDVGSPVYVAEVEAFRCDSGTQRIVLKETLESGENSTFSFDQDEFCSIDLLVRWTPGGALTTVPVGGFGTFKSVSGGSTIEIEIDAVSQTATLQ